MKKISRQWQRDEFTTEIHEADFELNVVTCAILGPQGTGAWGSQPLVEFWLDGPKGAVPPGFREEVTAAIDGADAQWRSRLESEAEQLRNKRLAEKNVASAELAKIRSEAAERDRLLATLAAPGWKPNKAPASRSRRVSATSPRYSTVPVYLFTSTLLAIFCFGAINFLGNLRQFNNHRTWEPMHTESTLEKVWTERRFFAATKRMPSRTEEKLWIRVRYPVESGRGFETEDIALASDSDPGLAMQDAAAKLPPVGSAIKVSYFPKEPSFPAKLYPKDMRPGIGDFASEIFLILGFHVLFALSLFINLVAFERSLSRIRKLLFGIGLYVTVWGIAVVWVEVT